MKVNKRGAEVTFIVDEPEGNILQVLVEFDEGVPRNVVGHFLAGVAKALINGD